jgi:hypothetical protein
LRLPTCHKHIVDFLASEGLSFQQCFGQVLNSATRYRVVDEIPRPGLQVFECVEGLVFLIEMQAEESAYRRAIEKGCALPSRMPR